MDTHAMTPSNLNYNAPQDSPDRKGIAAAQKQTNPKDPQADIREAMLKRVLKIDVYDDTEIDEDEAKAATDDLLKLFQAHQQELLSELLGELPKKRRLTAVRKRLDPTNYANRHGWNICLDQVVSVIERKINMQGEQLDSLRNGTESRPPDQSKIGELNG